MFVKSSAVFGVILAAAVAAAPASGQTCAGQGSCTVGTTASVTVGAVVHLTVDGAGSIALTPPDADAFELGYVQDEGPAITVKSNRTWNLSIHTEASAWTYAGTQLGVKPISDLEWSNTADGSFNAITGLAAAIVSNQDRTSSGTASIFFRTLYSSDFGDDRNAAGDYSIPLVFTLAAP
jgi:hypothetical protein